MPPRSIAALPGCGASVCVSPPLSARAPSPEGCGVTGEPTRSVPFQPLLAPEIPIRLWPPLVHGPCASGSDVPDVFSAMMVLKTTAAGLALAW